MPPLLPLYPPPICFLLIQRDIQEQPTLKPITVRSEPHLKGSFFEKVHVSVF